MVKRKITKQHTWLVYLLTLLFSVGFIIGGRYFALIGYPDWEQPDDSAQIARVAEIVADLETENGRQVTFMAEILRGEDKGELVQASQTIYDNYYPVQEAVETGDKILIYANPYGVYTPWAMLEYERFDSLIWLGAAFAAALLIFGRFKGGNTLISLAFTCLAIFAVFLPAVLSGQNIYLWTIIVSLYIIAMTMLLINGAQKKSFAAGMGCFAGLCLAGLLTVLMDKALNLTGMVNEETLYLQMLDIAHPIDLKAIIFASVVIGALGAIMDTAMDISSALNELRLNVPGISARQLISSGMNIGRDVVGTMVNTLVLAYIGSSLATTLLLVAYNVAVIELMNMELIVVEILQALVGSIGILLVIPLTSLICAALYPKQI